MRRWLFMLSRDFATFVPIPTCFFVDVVAMSIELAGLKEQHRLELENLTLTKQPLETLKCFILAILEYLKHSLVYLLTRGVWLLILCTVALASGFYIIGVDGPHQEVRFTYSEPSHRITYCGHFCFFVFIFCWL